MPVTRTPNPRPAQHQQLQATPPEPLVFVLNAYSRDREGAPTNELVETQALHLPYLTLQYCLGIWGRQEVAQTFSLTVDQRTRFMAEGIAVGDVELFAYFVEQAAPVSADKPVTAKRGRREARTPRSST